MVLQTECCDASGNAQGRAPFLLFHAFKSELSIFIFNFIA